MTDSQYAPAIVYAPSRPTNPLAIISLVASCVGLIFPLGYVAGIIMGHIALHQIKQTGEQGRGLALAGVIVGYCLLGVFLLLLALYVLLIVGIVVWGAGAASSAPNFG